MTLLRSVLLLAIFGLLLALPLRGTAHAQELADYDYANLEFRGFGVEFSWLYLDQIRPTLEGGLRADLGFLGPFVRLVPRLTFWSSIMEEQEIQRLEDQINRLCREQHGSCPNVSLGEIRRSSLNLSMDGHYVWREEEVLTPYAGGGLGLHFLNGRGDAIRGTFVEDLLSNIAPGLSLVGGLELELADALRIFTEARATAATDVRYVGLTLGGTWFFPAPRPGPWRPGEDREDR
jgi:hypothetical protein